MSSETPVHDFLLPHVTALVQQAMAEATPGGVAKDVVVAVLIDILTSPRFDTAATPPDADSAPHDTIKPAADVVLVGGASVVPPHQIGSQDEADFIKPVDWFSSNP